MKNYLGHNEIDDEGIIFLHKFPFLKVLNLSNNRITGEGVQSLSIGPFHCLKKLNLSRKVDILGGNNIRDESMRLL